MTYTRLNQAPDKSYEGSQVATAASGFTLNNASKAKKRNGIVTLSINFTTNSAYTAGTEVTIGTIADELKPVFPAPGLIWTVDLSQFYVDTNGAIKMRLGHNVSANASCGWMRTNYVAVTP